MAYKAERQRRHHSVDMTGWLHTHRSNEPPPPTFLGRSISTRVSSFGKDFFPNLRRQTSITTKFTGDQILGCFGPRRTRSGETPIDIDNLLNLDSAGTSGGHTPVHNSHATTGGRPPRSRPRSRSMSMSFFGSKRSSSGADWELNVRAAELNRKAAISKERIVRGGHWEIEEDEYLKPPAWKQVLRKLRAHAKRHVHPAPARDWENYDLESYEKNFDNGGKEPHTNLGDDGDELGVKERTLHTALLTKFHSTRYENLDLGLVRTISVPAPVRPKPKEEPFPIWQRRTAGPPLKLELTRSL